MKTNFNGDYAVVDIKKGRNNLATRLAGQGARIGIKLIGFMDQRFGPGRDVGTSLVIPMQVEFMQEVDPYQTRRMTHKKSGGSYFVEYADVELQSSGGPIPEGTKLTIYIGGDGKVWARPTAEFNDGRFEGAR